MQVSAITTPSGLSVLPYILGKLLQAVIAFLLTYAAIRLNSYATPVFSAVSTPISVQSPKALLATSLLTVMWSAVGIVILIIIVKIFDRYNR